MVFYVLRRSKVLLKCHKFVFLPHVLIVNRTSIHCLLQIIVYFQRFRASDYKKCPNSDITGENITHGQGPRPRSTYTYMYKYTDQ